MPLLLGMFGLLVVVLIAFFAIRLMNSGGAQTPPDADQQGQQQEQNAPHPNPPPEPLPKPALGQ